MPLKNLGVIVVTFNSADVIIDCIESLLAATGVELHIVIVDNASQDATLPILRDWASGNSPSLRPDSSFVPAPAPKPLSLDGSPTHGRHRIFLLETGINGGFAAGVNAGLTYLETDKSLDRFWILNPDAISTPNAPAAFASATCPEPGFSLMGGRILYSDEPEIIQIDGGTINRFTGVTGNLGLGQQTAVTAAPQPNQLAFISGASMVASRQFYKAAGPMTEDYFLYYEEVDWAQRRGALPLVYCQNAVVYHRAGTAIGSATLGRPASPFSLYFKHRGRIRFVRRHFPMSLPVALAYSFAKAVQLMAKGYMTEAATVLRASLGLPPSAAIRQRLSPEAAELAFGKPRS
jgi:GT2 family glycosyltransferase